MNIVKLKDKIMPPSNGITPEGWLPVDEFYNTYLKGKYAWWVACRYIVPFKVDIVGSPINIGLNKSGYILCEQDISNLLDKEIEGRTNPNCVQFIDTLETEYSLADFLPYIDTEITESVNEYSIYKLQNDHASDPDLTIDDLKKFRSWLADRLLIFDQDIDGSQLVKKYDAQTTHMLEYYSKAMSDDVIKYLQLFNATSLISFIPSQISTSNCGCASTSNISSLYNASLSSCDPISIYRNSIYIKMVEVFSNIQFWVDRHNENPIFCSDFLNYINNILSSGLPLVVEPIQDSRFVDCMCSIKSQTGNGVLILSRLKESLEYIISADIDGHKNFISDSFKDWAKYLYEHMYWV